MKKFLLLKQRYKSPDKKNDPQMSGLSSRRAGDKVEGTWGYVKKFPRNF